MLLSLPFALSRLTRETGCLPIPLPIRCIAIFPERQIIPFIVKKPAENPDMFLTMGVNTGRYCFMQTIGKEFNFEKGRGFPTTDLMYDSREKVVFKPIVLNADYTTRKRVDLISRLGNEEVAAYEILSADRLVEAYGKGELKDGLKEIAAGLDEESNPVLMLVKHKR